MVCIYCLNDKGAEEFSHTEHVIPQAFGRFANNLTLHCVCNTCNQIFGDSLELAFNRDSWEAINRFRYGLKSLEELVDLRYRNVSLTYSGPGDWHGVRFVFFNESGQIVLDLPPQLGIKERDGKWVYFTLAEVKKLSKEFLSNFETKGQIQVFTKNPEEYAQIVEELGRLGINFSKAGELDNLELDKEFEGQADIRVHMNNVIIRGISKIAFNYLAYCLGAEYALRQDFNNICSFICSGSEEFQPPFFPSNAPILFDEPEQGIRRLGHVIVLGWSRGHLDMKVKVSLFNDITYSVILCRSYVGIYHDIRHGHFFNLKTMSVHELHHTNKNLLL